MEMEKGKPVSYPPSPLLLSLSPPLSPPRFPPSIDDNPFLCPSPPMFPPIIDDNPFLCPPFLQVKEMQKGKVMGVKKAGKGRV